MLLLPVAWAQGWTDKRRRWTASERGRTARNRQAASRRVLTGPVPAARERAVAEPSGRKVNVPASPYSPCGGSFLPLKDVERAHAADLSDDRNLRLDHLPVGAIRVNSTGGPGGRPPTAIETQPAESSFPFNHMVNLPRAESAPCGETAVSSAAGSTCEPGELVLSTAGIAVAAGSNTLCAFPGAGSRTWLAQRGVGSTSALEVGTSFCLSMSGGRWK
jgi:hypothetical protein